MSETASPPPSPLARAERFMWLTARVLEQRLFAYHFLGGGDAPVERALAAYRNDDGGYGHALEPELRGPVSQPLHTAHALGVLDRIGRCDSRHIEHVCRYLTRISTREGALPALHPPARGYPVVPWLPVAAEPPSSLLATGPVVGVLHRNDAWHAWLFRATEYCWAAVDSLAETHPYEIRAALAFLEDVPDRPRAAAAAHRLGTLVRDRGLVVLDPARAADTPVPAGYAPGEHHFAYDYAATPGALARGWFTDAELERSLDHLASLQCGDGGWPAGAYVRAPGTAAESRPVVTLRALLTLRAHGRQPG